MDKFYKIEFRNPKESFGMGGPWLADCYLNEIKLKQQFLVDNYIISSDSNYLALNRFTEPKPLKSFGFFNLVPNFREFRIMVFDFKSQKYYQSKEKFDALFLQEMNGEEIVFFRAFHNAIEELKTMISFTQKDFDLINYEDFYETNSLNNQS